MNRIRIEPGPVTRVVLCRPEARNAFDGAAVAELHAAFSAPPASCRVVVLAAEGPAFCAGADAAWMRRSKDLGREENVREAEELEAMLRAVAECPRPVIARVQGAAVGGGGALVAACDIAVASDDAVFAFPEVRLGLAPAVIALHVLPRIGAGAARRWFLSGERFDAKAARAMGLVAEAVPAAELDARVDALTAELMKGAPRAQAEVKRLIRGTDGRRAVELIASLRAGPEGQEGLAAFLEKRAPRWP
jgi:methylglutaconyl-CoA hydratase